MPDAELHRFHNERVREVGTQLLGRRLYETMLYWETAEEPVGPRARPRVRADLAGAAEGRVLATLERSRELAARREGAVEEVARLKEESSKDIAVGGAGLAGTLIEAGLVDDFRLFVNPVVLGGGTPFFPALAERIDLELVETREFASPAVYLHYRLRR